MSYHLSVASDPWSAAFGFSFCENLRNLWMRINAIYPQITQISADYNTTFPEIPLAMRIIALAMQKKTLAVEEMAMAVAEMTLAVAEMTLVIAEMSLAVAEMTLAVEEMAMAVAEITLVIAEMTLAVASMTLAVASMTLVIDFALLEMAGGAISLVYRRLAGWSGARCFGVWWRLLQDERFIIESGW